MIDLRISLNLRGPLFERRDLAQVVDQAVVSELTELSSIGQRMVVDGTPRGATGLLRGSIATALRGAPARREAVIASSQFYAPLVERGRRPGKRPPVAALMLWVVRKLGIGDARRARSVAFLIARKIGARGTAGSAMFFRAAERLEPIARERWRRLGERLASQLGGR